MERPSISYCSSKQQTCSASKTPRQQPMKFQGAKFNQQKSQVLGTNLMIKLSLTSWRTHPFSGIIFINTRWIAARQIQIKLLKILNFHEMTSAI